MPMLPTLWNLVSSEISEHFALKKYSAYVFLTKGLNEQVTVKLLPLIQIVDMHRLNRGSIYLDHTQIIRGGLITQT